MRFLADAESFSARAFPPFNPPSRPSATAAGFFDSYAFAATPQRSHEQPTALKPDFTR